jgi:excisionase family DNA binding protein
MTDLPQDLITPNRAARRLRLNVATVYRWIQRGWLQAWKLPGRGVRVSRAEVLAAARPVQVQPRRVIRLASGDEVPAVVDTPAHRAAVEELRKLGIG